MDTPRIAGLLAPYLPHPLAPEQLAQVVQYLNLLVKWNAKTNLTAVRKPEEMVTRHFGESFFAASQLIAQETPQTAFDLGSGAGFPGVPLAIYAPEVRVTLIEAQNRKATFLKEVIRTLGLLNVTVHAGRAEDLAGKSRADLVTMRAVEKFTQSTALAVRLLRPEGRLALLIGAAQAEEARRLLPGLQWQDPVVLHGGTSRVLLVGHSKID